MTEEEYANMRDAAQAEQRRWREKHEKEDGPPVRTGLMSPDADDTVRDGWDNYGPDASET